MHIIADKNAFPEPITAASAIKEENFPKAATDITNLFL